MPLILGILTLRAAQDGTKECLHSPPRDVAFALDADAICDEGERTDRNDAVLSGCLSEPLAVEDKSADS